MSKEILITKASGEREIFEPEKLRHSLLRAKASEETVEEILAQVELELREGISTREIYDRAFGLLEKKHKPAALRYSLRNAVMDLGPTGFPFENLIAEIWRAKGFETKLDYIARGACVEHEIDVVAWNREKLLMIEAKFHNQFGLKSDLKVALYVKARFDDLKEKTFDFGGVRHMDENWLMTNTKFSEQAVKYAKCQSMNLVGWNYPTQGNLQDLIEESGLHPITVLQSISKHEKKNLLEAGVVHCKQAAANQDVLKQAGLSDEKIKKILEEIQLF